MQTMEQPAASGGAGAGVQPVNPRRRPAPWPVAFYRSAVGKKWVMAITGILLMGFVFVHMLGNLKLYQGAHDINLYGESLRGLAYPLLPRTTPLWLFRIGLIVAFALHIHAAWSLTRMNKRANAGGYQSSRDWQAANVASRSMRWTGIIIGLFVLWHLADFTWGFVNPDFVRGDVYRNAQASLTGVIPAIIYIVANIALGMHLFHGSWSMFQSLGLNNPRYNNARRAFAIGFAAIITLGNLSFPVGFLTGALEDDDCIEDGDRWITCEEVFTERIESGDMTVEEFDELNDDQRHRMRVAFEARKELEEGEEREE
jgi:succinate dehydrogenase / fumarate reductase, cytochrome b subunit